MKSLSNNDWIVLNSIVFQIHSIEDLTHMRESLLVQLGLLIDFVSADFFIASSEDDRTPVSPALYNYPSELDDKYMKVYADVDYSKGVMYSGKTMIYRETDIITDEERVKTEYYKQFYLSQNWHYSIHMVIAYQNKFMGIISLYRKKGDPDFEYDDIFVLEMLKDHLEYRLSKSMVLNEQSIEKLTVFQCAVKYELTRREETILQFLIDGLDNEVICEQICISNNTLKKHILNLYRKLGIKNRVQMFKLVKE